MENWWASDREPQRLPAPLIGLSALWLDNVPFKDFRFYRTAPDKRNFSVLATTPCSGLSLSR